MSATYSQMLGESMSTCVRTYAAHEGDIISESS